MSGLCQWLQKKHVDGLKKNKPMASKKAARWLQKKRRSKASKKKQNDGFEKTILFFVRSSVFVLPSRTTSPHQLRNTTLNPPSKCTASHSYEHAGHGNFSPQLTPPKQQDQTYFQATYSNNAHPPSPYPSPYLPAKSSLHQNGHLSGNFTGSLHCTKNAQLTTPTTTAASTSHPFYPKW